MYIVVTPVFSSPFIITQFIGAAPLYLGNKDTCTLMHPYLDTGDIILQNEFPLDNEITAGELHDVMTVKGGELLIETLDLIEKGTALRIKQNDEESSYAPMMNKSLGNLDFSKSAKEIHDLVRGNSF